MVIAGSWLMASVCMERMKATSSTDLVNHGQPGEQGRVRRRLAHDAEILRGLHEPGPEDFLPETIHRHPSGEGILLREELLREAEAIGWRTFRHRI